LLYNGLKFVLRVDESTAYIGQDKCHLVTLT
jgi:hypothetical protein